MIHHYIALIAAPEESVRGGPMGASASNIRKLLQSAYITDCSEDGLLTVVWKRDMQGEPFVPKEARGIYRTVSKWINFLDSKPEHREAASARIAIFTTDDYGDLLATNWCSVVPVAMEPDTTAGGVPVPAYATFKATWDTALSNDWPLNQILWRAIRSEHRLDMRDFDRTRPFTRGQELIRRENKAK